MPADARSPDSILQKTRERERIKAATPDPRAAKFATDFEGRTERVRRLRDELNLQLELVCHSRESLQIQMLSSHEDSLGISVDYLKKLKELTSCFNSLTDARIRLLKAEKQREDDMTPEEEKETVREFLRGMDLAERKEFMADLVSLSNAP